MIKKAHIKEITEEQVYRIHYTCPYCGTVHSFRTSEVASVTDLSCPKDRTHRVRIIAKKRRKQHG